jgi:hypothetical protein
VFNKIDAHQGGYQTLPDEDDYWIEKYLNSSFVIHK